MNKYLLSAVLLPVALFAHTQKIDSIYFHLYTDSLKKGVHNYINVDGKLTDGRWLPLTDKEIEFTSSFGTFENNDLVLPVDCKEDKIKVRAVLKSNRLLSKEITIWVKKKPDDERLPTESEIWNNGSPRKKTRKNRRGQ